MVIDRKLLEVLRCPVSKRPLRVMDANKLAELNKRIEAGEQRSTNGEVVAQTVQAALITDTSTTAYPVKDGWPSMRPEDGMVVESG